MPQCKPLPPLAEVQKAFNYDPDTGVITYARSSGRARVGSEAGCITPSGYRRIFWNGTMHRSNRLAWLLGHGSDPGEFVVEHKNLDKLDNRLSNLRLATTCENQWNRICRGWFVNDGKFVVRFSRKGVRHYIGSFGTAEEAEKAYREAKVALCGEFAPDAYK